MNCRVDENSFNQPCLVLPVADNKVCISCYNPVVVPRYDQHLPGINHGTCTRTHTHKIQINTLLSQTDDNTEFLFCFHFTLFVI